MTPSDNGYDSIFGLDIPLMRLVNVLKSAAYGLWRGEACYPTSWSRRKFKKHNRAYFKKGLQRYSRTPEGALYTYEWVLPEELLHITGGESIFPAVL